MDQIIGDDALSLNESCKSMNRNPDDESEKQNVKMSEGDLPSSQLRIRPNDIPINQDMGMNELLDLPSTQSNDPEDQESNLEEDVSSLESETYEHQSKEESDEEDLELEQEDLQDHKDEINYKTSHGFVSESFKDKQDVLEFLSGSFGTNGTAETVGTSIQNHGDILNDKEDLLGMLSGQFSADPTVVHDSLTPIPEVEEEEESLQNSAPVSPLKLAIFPSPEKAKEQPNVVKTIFVEEEAEVEDDEFMNMGGLDGEEDAALDQYDPEFVAEADKEVINDFSDIMELHR